MPVAALLALFAGDALAAGSAAAGQTFLWLAIILFLARLSSLVEKAGIPGVLGELLMGVALGNLSLLGFGFFDKVGEDATLLVFAELGVVILLFQIGLETTVAELAKVGARALAVAVVGVAVPFVLGTFVVGPLLLPGLDFKAYLFVGATLCATSVGITGRVFRDAKRLESPEARIVLGAAVIDDVLGLVILAVVTGFVQSGTVSARDVAIIVAGGLRLPRGRGRGRAGARPAPRPRARGGERFGGHQAHAAAFRGPGARLARPRHRARAHHRGLRRRRAPRAHLPQGFRGAADRAGAEARGGQAAGRGGRARPTGRWTGTATTTTSTSSSRWGTSSCRYSSFIPGCR